VERRWKGGRKGAAVDYEAEDEGDTGLRNRGRDGWEERTGRKKEYEGEERDKAKEDHGDSRWRWG